MTRAIPAGVALVLCHVSAGYSSFVGGSAVGGVVGARRLLGPGFSSLACWASALLGAHRVCYWATELAGRAPTLVFRSAFNACSALGGALEWVFTVTLRRVRGASGMDAARGVTFEDTSAASEPYGAASWPCLVEVCLQARLTRSDRARRFAHGTRNHSDS